MVAGSTEHTLQCYTALRTCALNNFFIYHWLREELAPVGYVRVAGGHTLSDARVCRWVRFALKFERYHDWVDPF